MGFLDNLGGALLDSLNSQMGVSENSPSGLDKSLFGGLVNDSFGALGEFKNKIDRSAQRSYVESGLTGLGSAIRPKGMETIFQEPDFVCIIKKRLFSSLTENYRVDLMNADEKLFLRATKQLFHNKCRAIAAYEQLTKLDRIGKIDSGFINDFALPQLFSAVDTLQNLGVNLIDAKTQATLETIRKVKALSDPNFRTTWIIAKDSPYMTDTGEGTGCFELTTVASLNITNSIKLGGGSADLTIEDPYKLMLITRADIERAISDASGVASTNNFFRITQDGLETTTETLKKTLNELRAARGAVQIRFLINENSLQFKKVRALIDEEGREINFSFDGGFLGLDSSVSIDDSAYLGINGLARDRGASSKNIFSQAFATSTEEEIFKQIISNIYQLLGLKQSTKNQIKNFNKQTEYVRRKMMLHYGGKAIIQPMDSVHIFISSKTSTDERMTRGLKPLFQGGGVLNKINDLQANLEGAIDDFKSAFGGGSGDSFIEIEKNAIAGPDFPMWLWTMMRNDFTRQAAGTHVFAGVVDSDGVTHSSDGGKYTLRVRAKDNSCYFKFGKTNFNPSVTVYNSALYDPITPFKLDFDASSGFLRGEVPPLLDENIRLFETGSIRGKNGRMRGTSLSHDLWKIQDAEPTPNGYRLKMHDPDGFVYRWKEGIGSLVWTGEPHSTLSLGSFASEAAININRNPFAGQDVMNVLSLLITGSPYNFNTFMRASLQSNQLSRDNLNNEDASASFYRGLINDLTKQNATWGNFIPFKKLIINEKGYNFLRSGEFDIVSRNARLSELLKQRAELFDQLTKNVPEFANSPQFYKTNANVTTTSLEGRDKNLPAITQIANDIIELDFKINQERKAFQTAVSNNSSNSLKIFGDDISFDPTITNDPTAVTESQRLSQRSEFRKKINHLTQRRLWKVKANEDPNLFIVDDSYDKNYDIQAFERSLAGRPELFKSTYNNVLEQIEAVAQVLDLEVFADTQGHIVARAPQYNRMPSSVFYRMLQEKEKYGTKLFPDYLESLFFNQTQGLTDQLEIIEDEIRIRAAALGFTDDNSARNLLSGSLTLGNANFSFITSEDDGRLGGTKDIRSLIVQANPDVDSASTALAQIDSKIQNALKSGALFDISRRITVTNEEGLGGVENDITLAIERIGARLSQKKDEPAPTRQSLLSNDRSLVGRGRSQLDAVILTEQISQLVSERQYVIKLLANAMKNLQQGLALNKQNDTSSEEIALFPALNKKKDIPEALEHMIEDEDYDDYGPRSGKRYVITDSQIISLSISEKAPDFTVMQVNGQLSSDAPPPALPEKFNFGDGGNGIVTAYAVDYDMWRMYGFRNPDRPANVPFFTNPQTQCAPYAVALLNKARKDIFQASLTVAGNEYIQPGEVYYLEDYDLLFYAESVSHSFSYGTSFTTSLNLKFGHNPGEYIPSMLDIIGKGLYTHRHQASLMRHVRQGNASGDTHVNILIVDLQPNQVTLQGLDALTATTQGEQNRKTLSNLLIAAAGLITPTSLGQQVQIELRTYSNSKLNISTAPELSQVADAVKQWILNPTQKKITTNNTGSTLFGGGSQTSLPDNTLPSPPIDAKYINHVLVDLGKDDETRSPSSQAWNTARSLALTGHPLVQQTQDLTSLDAGFLAKQEVTMLAYKVIDIWITFADAAETTFGTENTQAATANQADLEAKEAAIKAFNARLGKTS